MKPVSQSEIASYSTIRIEGVFADGSASVGTGFFFAFHWERKTNKSNPVIITNKHVIENTVSGKLVFTIADEKGNPLDGKQYIVNITPFASQWKFHPNPNIDLCALSITGIVLDAQSKGVRLAYKMMDFSMLPSVSDIEAMTAMEDVVVVGYPDGIWDEVNNRPVFRKGITATHYAFDYNGKKEFLVDASIFPGSSGSPVFMLNEGIVQDKFGRIELAKSRSLLLGVVYKVFQHNIDGSIVIKNIPTAQVPVARSYIPNNLGLVIKASEIKELEKLF